MAAPFSTFNTEGQLVFGNGAIFAQRNDVTGTTPVQFGIVQSAQVDIAWRIEKLRGLFQYPMSIARADADLTVKIKSALIFGALMGSVLFGRTAVAGQDIVQLGETATVPSSPGPYTITVINGPAFEEDLGVYYAAGAKAGLQLTPVATAPAAAQYTFNATTGVYTFNAADAGAVLKIYYRYAASATGVTLLMTNDFAGAQPTFSLTLHGPQVNSTSPALVMTLNKCMASKLSLPLARDKYLLHEIDCEVMDDGTGNIGQLATLRN